MPIDREYESIPGTFVYDGRRARIGYHLNQFLMSLNRPENRDDFHRDERAYVDRHPLSEAQKLAILERNYTRLLELGAISYYMVKLAHSDGKTYFDIAAAMSGMSRDDYYQMMLGGGRSAVGNRYKGDSR
jgi:protocatechuate 4,5-dioxygenase alpha chain